MDELAKEIREIKIELSDPDGRTYNISALQSVHNKRSEIEASTHIARALLAAGYAKRSDTIEEDVLAQIEVAARAIKPNAFAALEEFRAFSGKGPYIDRQIMLLEEECQGARSAADAAIYALRNLKDKP